MLNAPLIQYGDLNDPSAHYKLPTISTDNPNCPVCERVLVYMGNNLATLTSTYLQYQPVEAQREVLPGTNQL